MFNGLNFIGTSQAGLGYFSGRMDWLRAGGVLFGALQLSKDPYLEALQIHLRSDRLGSAGISCDFRRGYQWAPQLGGFGAYSVSTGRICQTVFDYFLCCLSIGTARIALSKLRSHRSLSSTKGTLYCACTVRMADVHAGVGGGARFRFRSALLQHCLGYVVLGQRQVGLVGGRLCLVSARLGCLLYFLRAHSDEGGYLARSLGGCDRARVSDCAILVCLRVGTYFGNRPFSGLSGDDSRSAYRLYFCRYWRRMGLGWRWRRVVRLSVADFSSFLDGARFTGAFCAALRRRFSFQYGHTGAAHLGRRYQSVSAYGNYTALFKLRRQFHGFQLPSFRHFGRSVGKERQS